MCTIKARTIRLTYDTVYETKLSIVFDNTKVQCFTTRGHPCSISIKINSQGALTLMNGSEISAKQVIINASYSQVLIYDSSSINVSGQSLNLNGTQTSGGGAQHIGQGGSCHPNHWNNYTTYGTYDLMPNRRDLLEHHDALGSMGKQGDAETAGGGRIVILAESVVLQGFGTPI